LAGKVCSGSGRHILVNQYATKKEKIELENNKGEEKSLFKRGRKRRACRYLQ
jgi:hypothetical protein